jgi:hypothetical protein
MLKDNNQIENFMMLFYKQSSCKRSILSCKLRIAFVYLRKTTDSRGFILVGVDAKEGCRLEDYG